MCTTAAWVNHSGGFSCLSAVSVKGFLSLSRLVSLSALCLKLAQAFQYALPFRRLCLLILGGFLFFPDLSFPCGKVTVVLLHNSLRLAVGCHERLHIGICMVPNSAISISRTGFGGISCSRIRFCRKSFALLTILRNRLGSQPLLLIDWLAFSCISVRLTSKIFASEIPDNNAMSAVLFHSCLAALSALISSSLGLFLPIFLVGRYTLFLSNTFKCCSGSEIWRLISSVYTSFISRRKGSPLKSVSLVVNRWLSYTSPFLMTVQPFRICPSSPVISFLVRTRFPHRTACGTPL